MIIAYCLQNESTTSVPDFSGSDDEWLLEAEDVSFNSDK